MHYTDLFSRNQGVLSPAQQQRLRDARVLILGNGGIGGTEALSLARAGVGNFTLVDFDTFEATNMNRQMVCREDNLGLNKARATAREIRAVNGTANVRVVQRRVPLDELDALVDHHDLVYPAADDFAYSICLFRAARRNGIPAILAVPSGLWAMVSLLESDGPTLEALLGLPQDLPYPDLKKLFEEPLYRLASFFYVLAGGWDRAYHREFVESGAPLAQVSPVVWTAGSLASFEGIKYLTGIGKAVTAPRYYWLNGNGAAVRRLPGPNLHTAMVAHRRLSYSLLNSRLGPLVERIAWRWWEE
jgi:molybdopterin/thiamine biosynthesis adenylyltransferase